MKIYDMGGFSSQNVKRKWQFYVLDFENRTGTPSIILSCPKSVLYISAPSYKRETKSVKCHDVYLNRTERIDKII